MTFAKIALHENKSNKLYIDKMKIMVLCILLDENKKRACM